MNPATELSTSDDYTPKILVVDDEQRIREACRLILEEENYAVSTAADGKAGMRQITEHHYDVILLDLMMPTMSGFDVLAQVKAKHPETVVIIITGYATLDHSVEAMKQGAFDFIPKPFTPDHLKLVVAKAIGHILALRDIANTRSRLRTMVNRLSDGVMCSNRDNTVVLANPAFLRLLGGKYEDAVGGAADKIVTSAPLREMIFETLKLPLGETAERVEELVITGDDGTEARILSARCVPFRDRTGSTIGVITVLHDITALRHMDRMKSNFVSMVSHEIRGPMNSVLMQLQVVLDGLVGSITEKQQEILERAANKIDNLTQMTSELLDLASIESGLLVPQKGTVFLGDIVMEQIALLSPQAAARSIDLSAVVPETLPSVLANSRNMEQVLSNLMTNAIKYTPDGGRVEVSITTVADSVCIKVSDTGFGIDEEDRKYLFNRFFRVKNEQTRFIQGTGLGLSIVKSIVDAHDGRISVESQPGVGSTFSVFLPIMSDLSPGEVDTLSNEMAMENGADRGAQPAI